MGPNEVLDKGFVATGAMDQFAVVTLTGDEDIAVATDATTRPIGVSQEEVLTDDLGIGRRVVNVRTMGISRGIVTSGNLSRNDNVVADANGHLQAVPGVAGTYYIVGYLLTEPDAVGDHVDVFLTPGAQVTV